MKNEPRNDSLSFDLDPRSLFSGECRHCTLHYPLAPAMFTTLIVPVGQIWRHLLAVIEYLSPAASFLRALLSHFCSSHGTSSRFDVEANPNPRIKGWKRRLSEESLLESNASEMQRDASKQETFRANSAQKGRNRCACILSYLPHFHLHWYAFNNSSAYHNFQTVLSGFIDRKTTTTMVNPIKYSSASRWLRAKLKFK